MRSDRGTKVLLILIVVGLWALTLTQVGLSASDAQASAPLYWGQETSFGPAYPPKGTVQAAAALSASLPLRWRVRYARLLDDNETDCLTIVNVLNLGTSATAVEVEWLDSASGSLGLSSLSLPSGARKSFAAFNVTSFTVNSTPFHSSIWLNVGKDFEGSVQVHADDPRVSVVAVLKCNASPSDQVPTSITDIPCDPVGTTMEYFQAGMPATWTPPMVEPEVPE